MARMKKTIAILLAVLFLLTLTISSVSAERAGRKTVGHYPTISMQSNAKPILDFANLQLGPFGPTPFPSISIAFRPSNKDGIQTDFIRNE